MSQTVAAVQGAATPAQGEAASNVVFEFLGLSAEYDTLSASDRQLIVSFYGSAIAEDNANPIPRTFSDIIDALEAEAHITVNDDTVMTAARNAIQAAQNGMPSDDRDDLLLLAALDGGHVQPAGHLSPVGGLAFARWFSRIYVFPTFDLRSKEECLAACKKAYENRLQFLSNSYQTSLANAKSIEERTGRPNPQFEAALRRIYEAAVKQAEFEYERCTKACHEQGGS